MNKLNITETNLISNVVGVFAEKFTTKVTDTTAELLFKTALTTGAKFLKINKHQAECSVLRFDEPGKDGEENKFIGAMVVALEDADSENKNWTLSFTFKESKLEKIEEEYKGKIKVYSSLSESYRSFTESALLDWAIKLKDFKDEIRTAIYVEPMLLLKQYGLMWHEANKQKIKEIMVTIVGVCDIMYTIDGDEYEVAVSFDNTLKQTIKQDGRTDIEEEKVDDKKTI